MNSYIIFSELVMVKELSQVSQTLVPSGGKCTIFLTPLILNLLKILIFNSHLHN